jgi:hypothetical protein
VPTTGRLAALGLRAERTEPVVRLNVFDRKFLSAVATWSLIASTVAAAAADPVAVRYPEGETHGFLVLRSLQGRTLASGELTALAKGDQMESRLTWRFRDGSLQDELVTYLQRPVLKLMSYKQIQRGPSFPGDVEVSFTREPNHYEVKQREKGKDEPEESSGTLDLPLDVYNGMTSTLLKNLGKDEIATTHIVAFTPKPRLVKMTTRPAGTDCIIVGDSRRSATRYVIALEVGGIAGIFAKVAGKEPPDLKFWVLSGIPPAFVKFEGPFFYEGPIWRIEHSAPRWPK